MIRTLIHSLRKSTQGAAAIEFAITAPVLLMLMFGILQLGIVLHANGGMRHAVGEGVRLAKVYRDATETQVLNEVRNNYSGIDPRKVTSLTFERGTTAAGAQFARVAMMYEVDVVIPFAPLPPIALSQTKTVYLPA